MGTIFGSPKTECQCPVVAPHLLPNELESVTYESKGKRRRISTTTLVHGETNEERLRRMSRNFLNRGGGTPEYTDEQLAEAENHIHYLSAHGNYERGHENEMVLTPGLTVVHLTSFGSSISVWLTTKFVEMSIDKKIDVLESPAKAKIIFSRLEDRIDKHTQPDQKRWNSDNVLQMVSGFGEAPNIALSFLTISGEYCWPAGLISNNTKSQYAIHRIAEVFGENRDLENMTIIDPDVRNVISWFIRDERMQGYFLRKLDSELDIALASELPAMSLEKLLDTDLKELQGNGLLPTSGFLFMMVCRDCSRMENDAYAQEQSAKDLRAFRDENLGITVPLADICQQHSCVHRVTTSDTINLLANEPDNRCKTKGCSKCTSQPGDLFDAGDYCLSCQETKAIMIYPTDGSDCLMCFTPEEIIKLTAKEYGQELDLSTINIKVPNGFMTNPINRSCRIDIRIAKIVLGWLGNENQKVFTGKIDNREKAIEFLNVLASFEYVVNPDSPSPRDREFLAYLRNLLINTEIERRDNAVMGALESLIVMTVADITDMLRTRRYGRYPALIHRLFQEKERLEKSPPRLFTGGRSLRKPANKAGSIRRTRNSRKARRRKPRKE